MSDWITDFLQRGGYLAIALLMILENIFPPIPSELIMPLAGFTASRGDLNVVGVIVAGTVGSVLGAIPLYFLGRIVGKDRLKAWADRRGAWIGLSGGDIENSVQWFDRHGDKAVLWGRLIPGVRSLLSIPAGIHAMPLPKFLGLTAIGSALWTSVLTLIGRALGARYELVERYVGPVTYVVIGAIIVALGVQGVRRRQKMGSSDK